MALAFEVPGPCEIFVADTPGAANQLGYLSNEGLASVDIQPIRHEVESTALGQEPHEIVYHGARCFITMTLTYVQDSELDNILTMPGGTTVGDAGVIGTRIFDDGGSSNTFKLTIAPVSSASGLKTYTFPRCLLDPSQLRDMGGNVERRVALVIQAFRSGSDGELPDGASATANFWTESIAS